MRLAAALEIFCYGTSEGVTKSWDTRGRGRKEPEKADTRSAQREQHISQTPIKATSRLNGGVSVTRLVTFQDGTKGNFKPASGEARDSRPFSISDGYQTEREVGAWEIAKLVGMEDLVAPATVRVIKGEKGALLEWQEGQVADNCDFSKKFDGKEDLARAAIFDYVIGNEDRHEGNWVVDDEHEKLHLIDHGLAFPDKHQGRYYAFNEALIDRTRELDARKELESKPRDLAVPYVKALPDILSTLKTLGLPSGSLRGVKERIKRVASLDKWRGLDAPPYRVDE